MEIPLILYDRIGIQRTSNERQKKNRKVITTTTVIIAVELEKYVLCARKNEEEWEMNKKNRKKGSVMNESEFFLFCFCSLAARVSYATIVQRVQTKVISVIKFAFLFFFFFVCLPGFYAPFTYRRDCKFSIARIEMIFLCFRLNRFFWFVNWFSLWRRLPLFFSPLHLIESVLEFWEIVQMK